MAEDTGTRPYPSFFVVGAQKAGTTTLHNWLSLQPNICLPSIKETHFFSHPDRYAKGIDWYLDHFTHCQADAIRGEVDPDYAFYREVPRRIHQVVSNPDIIFVFRNPIERAYSHYLMSVRRGYETLSFPEAIEREEHRLTSNDEHYMAHNSYLARGRYVEQVRRFNETLPDAEFLYIKFEDLFSPNMRTDTFARICEFIGLSSRPIMPDFSRRANQASESRFAVVRDLIYGSSRIKKVLGTFVPSDSLKLMIANWLDRLNRRPINPTPQREWRDTLPQHTIESIEGEIVTLESLTGLCLDNWRTTSPSTRSHETT